MFERERRGEIAILRMAHGKANTLDLELLEGIAAELDAVEREAPRALVLSAGGTIFSAGVDLFRIVDGGAAYVDRFVPALERALARLFTFPLPVVAAVNGHAVAGGCILALACDYRILARGKGRIGIPEQRVGVPFPTWALEIVRFAVSPSEVQAMMHLGRTYLPDEALARGLAEEAAEPAELLERAVAVAADLGAIAPETFRLTKRQLRRTVEERVERGAAFDAEILAAWKSPATHEVIRDYLARTFAKGK
jgi:enoyl-CoA hydratase